MRHAIWEIHLPDLMPICGSAESSPGEFRRRPTARALELCLVIGFGRRGLSESWGLHSAGPHGVCVRCCAAHN